MNLTFSHKGLIVFARASYPDFSVLVIKFAFSASSNMRCMVTLEPPSSESLYKARIKFENTEGNPGRSKDPGSGRREGRGMPEKAGEWAGSWAPINTRALLVSRDDSGIKA
jgi:hypothetical protein